MSLAVLRSRALAGMEALPISVEVHLANGLPSFTNQGTNAPNSTARPEDSLVEPGMTRK
jgi:hypothetical protein